MSGGTLFYVYYTPAKPGCQQSPGLFGQGLVIFWRLWYSICKGAAGKQHAVCPPHWPCAISPFGGTLLESPTLDRKGGQPMITLSELIQIGGLIVGVIDLVLRLIEMDRNHRQ